MASASSLGLPQPPVAVQTASQAGATNAEWNSIPRPTFWNGVGTEAVFEKDTAHKGRAMGLASAGTLALVATPTQTNGIEDTYSKPLNPGGGGLSTAPSIVTKVDTFSFDVSAPIAAVPEGGGSALWASNLTFSRKRARLGGVGAGQTVSAPLFNVIDVFDDAGVQTTSVDDDAPTLNFTCPLQFNGVPFNPNPGGVTIGSVNGSGISVNNTDPTNPLISTALVAGTNIALVPSGGNKTITINSTGAVASVASAGVGSGIIVNNTTPSAPAISASLTAGSNITLTPSTVNNSIIISASGGPGGGQVDAVATGTPLQVQQTITDNIAQFAVSAAGGTFAPTPTNANGIVITTGAATTQAPYTEFDPTISVVSTALNQDLNLQAKGTGDVTIKSDLNVQGKCFFSGTYDGTWTKVTGGASPPAPTGPVKVAGQLTFNQGDVFRAGGTGLGVSTCVVMTLASTPADTGLVPWTASNSPNTLDFGLFGAFGQPITVNYFIVDPAVV